MSKRKNRTQQRGRSNGRSPGSNILPIHRRLKKSAGKEIATKVLGPDGQITIQKRKVTRRVTPLEHSNVKLNEMRETVLKQQKIIVQLRQQKNAAELARDKLEIQASVTSNNAFRSEVGLKAGLNLFQDVETQEWFWGDDAPDVAKSIEADQVEIEDDEDLDEGTDETETEVGEETTEDVAAEVEEAAPEKNTEAPTETKEAETETAPAAQ